MLTQQERTELKNLFDSVVNEKFAELKSEITNIKAKLAFSQVPQEDVKSLKADVITMSRQLDDMRFALSKGRGNMAGGTTLSKLGGDSITPEEYKVMLPAKLAAHSLGEVVYMQAMQDGIDPTNDAEWQKWAGVDRPKPKRAEK